MVNSVRSLSKRNFITSSWESCEVAVLVEEKNRSGNVWKQPCTQVKKNMANLFYRVQIHPSIWRAGEWKDHESTHSFCCFRKISWQKPRTFECILSNTKRIQAPTRIGLARPAFQRWCFLVVFCWLLLFLADLVAPLFLATLNHTFNTRQLVIYDSQVGGPMNL